MNSMFKIIFVHTLLFYIYPTEMCNIDFPGGSFKLSPTKGFQNGGQGQYLVHLKIALTA